MTGKPTVSTADSVDAVGSTLDRLIKTCKDGEQGFQAAAGGADDPNLRHLFESYSQQRAEFAAELQLEAKRLGQEPADSGHASAGLHRGWVEITEVVTGRSEGPIIAECERGEDAAVRAYAEALATDLPTDVRAVVERQSLKVQETHDQLRSLEQMHSRHS